MLKKAGIIVAASTASLLALSPLAFAGGDQGEGHGNQNSHGLVNGLDGNNVNVPVQACNNDIQGQVGLVPVQDAGENGTVGLNGAVGALFGEGKAQQENNVDNSRLCGQENGGAGYGNG